MIGVGIITSIAATNIHTGILEPIGTSLEGSFVAQFAIGVLAVLAVTSEYSTGMIRSTFLAAPQRRMVITAKAAVIAAAAFTVGTIASLAAFLTVQTILTHHGVSLTAPGALRSIIGVGLYLAVLGIYAVGLATIIRNTANKFLPGNAGQAIFNNIKNTTALTIGLAFVNHRDA